MNYQKFNPMALPPVWIDIFEESKEKLFNI